SVAVIALVALTVINCFGVRSGSNTQSVLMLLKLAAIATLIIAGFASGTPRPSAVSAAEGGGAPLFLAFGAAMTPVMFAYGGWQTASFVSGEMKRPERDLTIGLLLGVAGVITVYLLVNIVCIRVLGTSGLAATTTPASAVMRTVLG